MKKRRYTEFNSKVGMSDPQFKLGMVFPTTNSLKQAIKEIKIHRGIRLEKNDKRRVRVVCEARCPFVLYGLAMPNSSSFLVKTLNEEHNCGLKFSSSFVNSKWLCERYLNKWRAQHDWSFLGFQQQVKDDFQCDVSKWKFY